MESYNRGEVIAQYVEAIQNDEITFSEVRKALQNQNINAKEINLVINQIDKRLQRQAAYKADNAMGSNLYYGGLAVLAFGLVLTLGTYTKIFNIGNYFIAAWGLIVGGAFMAMRGYTLKDKKIYRR